MSINTMDHPVLRHLATINTELSEVADLSPSAWSTPVKRTAILELDRLEQRLVSARLRVLAVASDVAEADGHRNPGTWIAHHTRSNPAHGARELKLATALDRRYPVLADALADAEVNQAQARVIADALDALPGDLDPHYLQLAEKHLIGLADQFNPRELARLGAQVLHVLDPALADEVDRKALEDAERNAREKSKLKFTDLRDGTTRITGVGPTAVMERLKAYLHAYTNPRRRGLDPERDRAEGVSGIGADGERTPYPRRLMHAFAFLLEHLDPTQLPFHGGDATRITVTINLDHLLDGLGVAVTDTGGQITASEARRLACTAGIIPAVLNGKSEVLDLGRSRRLFSSPQIRALRIRHRECVAEGCTIPSRWCEAHHVGAWAQGGRTDLANAALLCSYHHHRAHDPRYTTSHTPAGDWQFHLRT